MNSAANMLMSIGHSTHSDVFHCNINDIIDTNIVQLISYLHFYCYNCKYIYIYTYIFFCKPCA